MAGQVYPGFLRQFSTSGTSEPGTSYPLSDSQETVIGRDPSCQITINPEQYLSVSRRHAEIRPLQSQGNSFPGWEICDLTSVNGTYVNGKQLRGCQKLLWGDRIELGQDGPKFIFECALPTVQSSRSAPSPLATGKPDIPGVSSRQEPKTDALTFSLLFPIASRGQNLTQKAFLIPGILTVLFVVLMFASVGEPSLFNPLLATYLAGAAYYFVYQLCGKPKPWWVMLTCAVSTCFILASPILPLFITVFREILPGSVPKEGELINFSSLFVRMFFGAGLMEELLKAIPVLGAYCLGLLLSSPWRKRIGVWEPLDGILLGAASAVGFTLWETLGQYVPNIIDLAPLQPGIDDSQLLGLQLLIPRIIGSVAGHLAYSGYFGYFIGLSVLKRRQRWQILIIGCLSAAALHALWNVTGYISNLLLAVVGVVSYAFLAAAILKARTISPTRSQNFATRLFKD